MRPLVPLPRRYWLNLKLGVRIWVGDSGDDDPPMTINITADSQMALAVAEAEVKSIFADPTDFLAKA